MVDSGKVEIQEHFSRNLLFGIIIFAFIICLNSTVFAEDGINCSSIAREKIENALKKLNVPYVEILSVKQTPFDGICEIAVQDKGGIHVFYSDPLVDYMLLGTLVVTKSMINLTAQTTQKIQDQKRIDVSKISLTEALVMGDKNASKKVNIFSDPD